MEKSNRKQGKKKKKMGGVDKRQEQAPQEGKQRE